MSDRDPPPEVPEDQSGEIGDDVSASEADEREQDAGGRRSRRRRRTRRELVELATDRYGLVMALVVITYVLASVLGSGNWQTVLITAIEGLTVIVALAASDISRRRLLLARRLAVAAVVLAALAGLGGDAAGAGRTGEGIAQIIGSVLLAGAFIAIIGRIARHQSVTEQTVLGAIDCYLLFGLIYAFMYAGLSNINHQSILKPHTNSLSDFLFFSYTTLTTVGYGDFVPYGAIARTLASLEALMGQIFLVTVVARLVALWTPRRPPRPRLPRGRSEAADPSET